MEQALRAAAAIGAGGEDGDDDDEIEEEEGSEGGGGRSSLSTAGGDGENADPNAGGAAAGGGQGKGKGGKRGRKRRRAGEEEGEEEGQGNEVGEVACLTLSLHKTDGWTFVTNSVPQHNQNQPLALLARAEGRLHLSSSPWTAETKAPSLPCRERETQEMMDFLLAALADFYRNNAKKQVGACPWLCARCRLEGGGH